MKKIVMTGAEYRIRIVLVGAVLFIAGTISGLGLGMWLHDDEEKFSSIIPTTMSNPLVLVTGDALVSYTRVGTKFLSERESRDSLKVENEILNLAATLGTTPNIITVGYDARYARVQQVEAARQAATTSGAIWIGKI